jgi:hypothetical protein
LAFLFERPLKKIILLLALFVNLLVLKAQDSLYTNSNAIIGFSAGINFSKFNLPFKDLSVGTQPTIGFFQQVKLSDVIYLKLNETYSPKKSVIMHPLMNIRDKYIDLSVLPQYKITEGLMVQAGMVFNADFSYFDYSELNMLVGVQVRLQKRLNFDVTYQIPTFEGNTSNLNLSINYIVNKRKNKEPKLRKISRESKISRLDELNSGILLVRLKNWDQKISAHKSAGNTAIANALTLERRSQNFEILKAFKKDYHFSDVAFFYSDDSKNVKEGNFDGIFLNDSLVRDPTIKFDKSRNWFIGEVDFLEMDTTKHWQNSHYNIYTKKYEKTYYSSSPN